MNSNASNAQQQGDDCRRPGDLRVRRRAQLRSSQPLQFVHGLCCLRALGRELTLQVALALFGGLLRHLRLGQVAAQPPEIRAQIPGALITQRPVLLECPRDDPRELVGQSRLADAGGLKTPGGQLDPGQPGRIAKYDRGQVITFARVE
jgi:hypothetical protein